MTRTEDIPGSLGRGPLLQPVQVVFGCPGPDRGRSAGALSGVRACVAWHGHGSLRLVAKFGSVPDPVPEHQNPSDLLAMVDR